MADREDPASPLDDLYAEVKRTLASGSLGVERVVGPLEGAILAYRRALEAEVAREYAANHSLRFGRPAGPSLEAAAVRVKDLVLALPELLPGALDVPDLTPADAPSVVAVAAPPPSAARRTGTLADVLPRLVAG